MIWQTPFFIRSCYDRMATSEEVLTVTPSGIRNVALLVSVLQSERKRLVDRTREQALRLMCRIVHRYEREEKLQAFFLLKFRVLPEDL